MELGWDETLRGRSKLGAASQQQGDQRDGDQTQQAGQKYRLRGKLGVAPVGLRQDGGDGGEGMAMMIRVTPMIRGSSTGRSIRIPR